MNEENERTEKPTPPPLRDVKDGAVPKRRGRPPKVRPIEPVKLPEGVIKAEDVPQSVSEVEGGETIITEGGRLTVTTKTLSTPLLTLHLRRVGAEITDGSGTVHIPASGAIPDGTHLVAHFYREE